MSHRESASRRSARRRAQQARAERDHAHARREEQLEALLTDFLEATARVTQRLDAASRRAERIMQSAEDATAGDRVAARDAVRQLHGLITVGEIAKLCGLTQRAVRQMLAASQDGSRQASADAPCDAQTTVEGDPRNQETPGWRDSGDGRE